MNLLILGPLASGKGAQAEKLVKKFNLAYVEMGGLLRKIAQEKSPLGQKVNHYINVLGQLVPDEVIIEVINDYLKNIGRLDGILFDGFPRIISQAEYFEKFLAQNKKKIDLVVFLELPKEEIFKRLANRRICQKCGKTYNLLTVPSKKPGVCDFCGGELIVRSDETPERITSRLGWFEKQVRPLIEYYRKRGLLEEVDGDRPIEVVYEDILGRLKKRGLLDS